MARSLGGVALPDGGGATGSIEWTNRHDWSPVAQAATRTLGGALVLHESALLAGRPITLEAREGVSWLSLATVEALLALAAVAGASYTLVWGAESHRVAFDRTRGATLQVVPIWPHSDTYTGRVHLVTI